MDRREGRQHVRTWKKIQETIVRKLVGGSSIVAGFAVRGDVGWRKLEKRREDEVIIWMKFAENE